MSALLLLCARYGRVSVKVGSEEGQVRELKRAAPPRKWLQDLAASQGLERLYHDSLVDCGSRPQDLSVGHAQCVALVRVVPGSAADGALTPLCRQEEHLRDLLFPGALYNIFTLKVVKVQRLSPPLLCAGPIRSISDLWLPHSCVGRNELQESSAITRERIQQALEVSGQALQDFLNSPLVLRLPVLCLELLLAGSWQKLVLQQTSTVEAPCCAERSSSKPA